MIAAMTAPATLPISAITLQKAPATAWRGSGRRPPELTPPLLGALLFKTSDVWTACSVCLASLTTVGSYTNRLCLFVPGPSHDRIVLEFFPRADHDDRQSRSGHHPSASPTSPSPCPSPASSFPQHDPSPWSSPFTPKSHAVKSAL